jgi:Protein of unknown function (Hypoth_ymh)
VLGRLSDAVAWLESHGLLGPFPENPNSNVRRVTAAGRDFAKDDHALTRLWAGDRLAGKFDPLLASALHNFHYGDYETACFAAMKQVEIAVREAAGLPNALLGVKLMQEASKPEGGKLTNRDAEDSGRASRHHAALRWRYRRF